MRTLYSNTKAEYNEITPLKVSQDLISQPPELSRF